MRRASLLLLVVVLFAIGLLIASMNGCGGGLPPGNHILAGKFQHVVIIFQENRSTDNLFHDPVLIARGADIATSGINSKGQKIKLSPLPLATPFDLNHQHEAFVQMFDGGKMDGADQVEVTCIVTNCPPPNPQFAYVDPADVQPYFQMAERYTFGDRMFQTNQGPSFPAHLFIISGTSALTADSPDFVADNGYGIAGPTLTGCISPPDETVGVVDASGNEIKPVYPCTEHPTLTDELNTRSISWRYYTPTAGTLWTAPNAIQHMCGPNAALPNATACTSKDWNNHVVIYAGTKNPAPVLTDIAKGHLPQVSWVIPSGRTSDHPGNLHTSQGPSWVASVVNAIGNSSYWENTAIIVTWDDWGGWYDHVPPYKIVNDGKSWGSGYVYGFRVPLIVISPYARAGYISHVNHDFGSILHFVEEAFNLPSLGYADAYADDLSDCFNFQQTPLAFQTIRAPLSASFFMNEPIIDTDPDTD
ncbi:MAG TPA: alkaline phosphatase family protein [Candidatus Sulfotelmatobacter sp.]|nr:alkaline phosphatase family protein [Candidatus Sulfotelmatobacter sp.]